MIALADSQRIISLLSGKIWHIRVNLNMVEKSRIIPDKDHVEPFAIRLRIQASLGLPKVAVTSECIVSCKHNN